MSKTKAFIKQVSGLSFAGKSDSNHWVMMDGPKEFFGSDAGIHPKELLLLSLAGCTSSDVIAILQKKRVKLDDFEMNIEADLTEEHPKIYSKIYLEYVFYGKNIKEKDVLRAIELSQTKYCGVTAMLEKTVEIVHSHKIIDTGDN